MAWDYTCNNKTYIDKTKAVIESTNTHHPIYFHAPTSYDTFDFSLEPSASWLDILKSKALQYRESYDYVRIFFSGGCDSKTVLQTFISNGIYIDEIVCLRSGITSRDFEIDFVAEPYLQKIQKSIPNTKINMVTPTNKDYEDLFSDKNYYMKLIEARPMYCWHFGITNFLDNVAIYDQKGKTANIFGMDKPFIRHCKGSWYTYFLDVDVEPQPGQINFFIDDPEIHSKQCHMLLNKVKEDFLPENYNSVSSYFDGNQDFWNKHSGRLMFDDSFIPKLPEHGTLQFDTGEEIYCWNQKERLALEVLKKEDPDLVKKWKRSMDEFSTLADGKWWNQGRPELGSVGIFSKFYSLENKGIIKTVDDLYPNGFTLDT